MKLKHIAEMTFVVSHQKLSHAWAEANEKADEVALILANIMYLQAREEWEENKAEYEGEHRDFRAWFNEVYIDTYAARLLSRFDNVVTTKFLEHVRGK